MWIISNKVRLLDYWTYGRDMAFFGGLFLETVPLLFALVPGSIPIFTPPIDGLPRIFLFVFLSFVLLISLCLTIRWIARKTYSVELRTRKGQVSSIIAYIAMGITASLIGYLLFIMPYPGPKFQFDDALLGIVYSLVYAQIAAVVLAMTFLPEAGRNPPSKDITRFLDDANKIKNSTAGIPEGLPDEVADQARNISEEIRNEPATGTRELDQRLESWASDFEDESDFLGRQERLKSAEFSGLSHDLCSLS